MKILVILMTLVSIHVSASDFTGNVETVLNPPTSNEVFVPPGFDDMDDAELTFLNRPTGACILKSYSLPPVIDKENKVIRVSNFSMVLKGDFCVFNNTVAPTTLRLGELPAGDYKIEFETEKGSFESYSQIQVAKSAGKQKDDFTYAPLDINELTVVVNREAMQIELTLPGEFPNSCYLYKETKVIDSRSKNVIEVLPIIENRKGGGCAQAIVKFVEKVTIPYTETGVKKLIHIRSANGVAINRVISL